MSSFPLAPEGLDAALSAQPGAPWTRDGAPPPPDAADSQQRAAKWRNDVQRDERDERRRRERRKRRQAAREEEAAAALEKSARRMYLAGFFLLPFVWLIALFYFRDEHRNPDANPAIKRYLSRARIFLALYTVVFFAWFVLFEVFADGKLKRLNILYFNGQSPNGF